MEQFSVAANRVELKKHHFSKPARMQTPSQSSVGSVDSYGHTRNDLAQHKARPAKSVGNPITLLVFVSQRQQ